MKIDKPGLYRDFPTAAYFDDPCPEPSFTQSLAKILLDRSPLHAFQAHPRLYVPTVEEDGGEAYDKAKAIGNAAHALMLGRGKELAVEDFPDFRTKEAKAFKAAALEAGREPILQKHFDVAMEMVGEAKAQLSVIPGCERAFVEGDAEVVIAACEDGLWLRSMIDWITPNLREVWDYKTSGQSASPWTTGRLMASAGWDIQGAMHSRILDAVDPNGAGRRRFFYVAQEQYEPYALTVNELSESVLTIGRKKLDYAIGVWRSCMESCRWPAYPSRIVVPEYPNFAMNSWLEREERESGSDYLMAG